MLLLKNGENTVSIPYDKGVVVYDEEMYGMPMYSLAWAAKLALISDFLCHEDEKEPEPIADAEDDGHNVDNHDKEQ